MNNDLTPKEYQRKAIDKLKKQIKTSLDGDTRPIVLKAPTGSGKTFMLSKTIEEIVEENADDNFCFVWASIGKGELHIQSKDSVSDFLNGYPECTLIEDDFFGTREFIKNKEIVFLNWEKLIMKDNATGKWVNNLMKDQEGLNFINVLEKTHERNTKIILIIDESHIGAKASSRISEFKDEIIRPNFTIEMSATPLREPTVEVYEEDVIEEGMIKASIVVNEGISKEDRATNELDSEQLVLTKAEEKRLQLIEEYQKVKEDGKPVVNPLVLIQIPNKDAGEDKKIVIQDFLRDKGITTDNGRLKMWCDDYADFDKKEIKHNDDTTDYLVFKTAVATGWDCPRAHILVKFREGKSETFEIQTVGRILRTAEAKHYDNDILDNAYIFTNEKDFETKRDTYSPNRIKTEFSTLGSRKKEDVYNQTQLKSEYRSRQGNYNSADSRIEKYIEKEFMKYFELTEEDKENYLATTFIDKLAKKGVQLIEDGKTSLIAEKTIKYHADDEKNYRVENVDVRNAENDIKSAFYKVISENLNGLAYVRSRSPISTSIVSVFDKFYNGFTRKDKISSIQKLVVNYDNKFGEIINKATASFKEDFKGKYSWDKYEYKFDYRRSYSIDCNKVLDIEKALYKPFMVRKDENDNINKLEEEFLKYLDENKNVVWIFENGTELMKSNFGIAYNNRNSTFQPDFIVLFKNGTVGIYDTKPIGYRIEDTKQKAEALARYIKEINKNRGNAPKVIGGIVVQQRSGGRFYYNEANKYVDMSENNSDWLLFDDLLEHIENDVHNQEYLRNHK